MDITNEQILEWDPVYQQHFVQSLSGYHGMHLVGSRSTNDVFHLNRVDSVVHVNSYPPQLGFIVSGEENEKLIKNLESNRSYTINHVHKSFVRNAHYVSVQFDESISEFDACGLTAETIHHFRAPFVAESKIQIGLSLVEVQKLKTSNAYFVVGEVAQIQMDEGCIQKDGYLDLEKVKNVCVTGANLYSSVNKLRSYPTASPEDVPAFGTKERPDQIVYDEATDTYGAALLPYGTNIGAPSIIPDDVSTWKNQGINKFNHGFNNKVDEIKNRYAQLIDEFKMNELIYSCKMNFEPIIGQSYHLYHDETKGNFLSLIPPHAWDKEFVGTFKLNYDGSWEQEEKAT